MIGTALVFMERCHAGPREFAKFILNIAHIFKCVVLSSSDHHWGLFYFLTLPADARAILSEGDLPRGLRPHTAQPARTPTGALPSAEGDGAAAGYLPPESFPTQFIKNIIEDVLDDFREQIRRDILDVHTSMLKQFLIQQVGGATSLKLSFAYSLKSHIVYPHYIVPCYRGD